MHADDDPTVRRVLLEAIALAKKDVSILKSARGVIDIDTIARSIIIDQDAWLESSSGEVQRWLRDAQEQNQVSERLTRSSYERLRVREVDYIPTNFAQRAIRVLLPRLTPEDIQIKIQTVIQSDSDYRSTYYTQSRSREALIQSLVERSILPAFRTALNNRLDEDLAEDWLRSSEAGGLSQLLPTGFDLESVARDRLELLISQLSTASIGIAGPRGSGKTTLLGWICRARADSIRIPLAAPVKYDSKDFLLHVMSEVCKSILRREGRALPTFELVAPPVEDDWLRRYILRVVGIGTLITGAIALLTYMAIEVVQESPSLFMEGVALFTQWIATAGITIPPSAPNSSTPEYASKANTGILLAIGSYAWLRLITRRTLEPIHLAISVKRPRELPPYEYMMRGALVARALAVLGIPLLVVAYHSGTPVVFDHLPAGLLGFAALAILFALGWKSRREGWDFTSSEITVRYPYDHIIRSPSVGAAARARELLIQIGFEQSRTSETAETLGFGMGGGSLSLSMDTTRTSGRTFSAVPWTQPVIVAELRNLLEIVAQRTAVVIGIDELDKIESPELAATFVDDIKSIFGIPNCYFLVSISEDALADFERRGLPFRNSFDSAFDEVVALEYFSLQESARLLRSRVVALPLQFIALCHALSGGLPRDLIRVARHLYDLEMPVRLQTAAWHIVTSELCRKAQVMASAMREPRSHPWPDVVAIWTDQANLAEADTQSLLSAARTLEQLVNQAIISTEEPTLEEWKVFRLAREMSTFVYFCATILEITDDGRVGQTREPGSVVDLLSQAGRARQAFSAHPALAWNRLESLRSGEGWDTLGTTNWLD